MSILTFVVETDDYSKRKRSGSEESELTSLGESSFSPSNLDPAQRPFDRTVRPSRVALLVY
jgi:hypothetical protein